MLDACMMIEAVGDIMAGSGTLLAMITPSPCSFGLTPTGVSN